MKLLDLGGNNFDIWKIFQQKFSYELFFLFRNFSEVVCSIRGWDRIVSSACISQVEKTDKRDKFAVQIYTVPLLNDRFHESAILPSFWPYMKSKTTKRVSPCFFFLYESHRYAKKYLEVLSLHDSIFEKLQNLHLNLSFFHGSPIQCMCHHFDWLILKEKQQAIFSLDFNFSVLFVSLWLSVIVLYLLVTKFYWLYIVFHLLVTKSHWLYIVFHSNFSCFCKFAREENKKNIFQK